MTNTTKSRKTQDVAITPDKGKIAKGVENVNSALGKVEEALDKAKTGYNTARRFRFGGAPLAAMGGLWLTGAYVHANDLSAPAVAAATLATTATTAWLKRDRLGSGRRRAWAATVAATSAGWLGVAASIGVHAPMPAILAGATAVLGGPWWWHYRNRLTHPDEKRPVAAPALDYGHDTIWAERIGCADGKLPGSRLLGWTAFENGDYATVHLSPGKQVNDNAIGASIHVASAYGVRRESLFIEAHEDGIEGHIKVTKLKRNPLLNKATFAWPGPSLDPKTGLIPIGPYMDGKGQASIRFFLPGSGAIHTLISGAPGSGKSRLLSMLVAEAAYSPLIVPWIVDGQDGQSLPEWQDKVGRYAAGYDDGIKLILAARDMMHARSKAMSQEIWTDEKGRTRKGRGSFTPTKDRPLLVIFVDEAHELLRNKKVAEAVMDIGKEGRKTGIALVLVTQVPSVAELGGKPEIRAMVASGNVIVLRTQDAFSGDAVLSRKLPVEPHLLPQYFENGSPTQGLGFCIGGLAPRAVPMRVMDMGDPYDWAEDAPIQTLEQEMEDLINQAMSGQPAKVRGSASSAAPKHPGDEDLAAILRFYLTHEDETAQGLRPSQLVTARECSTWAVAHANLKRLAAQGAVHEVQEGVFEIDVLTKQDMIRKF